MRVRQELLAGDLQYGVGNRTASTVKLATTGQALGTGLGQYPQTLDQRFLNPLDSNVPAGAAVYLDTTP